MPGAGRDWKRLEDVGAFKGMKCMWRNDLALRGSFWSGSKDKCEFLLTAQDGLSV